MRNRLYSFEFFCKARNDKVPGSNPATQTGEPLLSGREAARRGQRKAQIGTQGKRHLKWAEPALSGHLTHRKRSRAI